MNIEENETTPPAQEQTIGLGMGPKLGRGGMFLPCLRKKKKELKLLQGERLINISLFEGRLSCLE